MKLKEIKNKINADSYSIKNNVVTIRRGFFYKHGRTTQHMIDDVKKIFPDAEIIDSGEHWASFRGGASVANSSHWFVKFVINN